MNHPKEIVLTLSNVASWPRFMKELGEGRLIADSTGRLRYLHGAPVGKLVLVHVNEDGTPHYQESADEWFDPSSKKANVFVWP